MASQPDIFIITGPTASGKTARALTMAQKGNGAVVMADSRMVYQRLDIGTGKPTWEYRQLAESPWLPVTRQSSSGPIYMVEGIDHYLLDCVAPQERWTLADWLGGARAAITKIVGQGKQPIVTGGTGLYLKALVDGYQPPPTDPSLRAQLEELADEALITQLNQLDPVTLNRERANRRRLVRALEIVKLTGRPIGAQPKLVPPSSRIYVVDLPQADLFARIDERVLARLDQGMVEEVQDLLARGVEARWLRGLGLEYRVITDWLADQSIDRTQLALELSRVIHAYAKRQKTFLRSQFTNHQLTLLS